MVGEVKAIALVSVPRGDRYLGIAQTAKNKINIFIANGSKREKPQIRFRES